MNVQFFKGSLFGGAKLVKPKPTLHAHILYVDGSSVGQYIDFGSQSGQCLYEPDLCENGLTSTFWFKYPTVPTLSNIGFIMDSGSSDPDTLGISLGITDTQFFIKVNLRESSHQYKIPLFPANTWQFITYAFTLDSGLSLYINACDAVASRLNTTADYTIRDIPIPATSPPSPFRFGGHDDHKAEMFIEHVLIWYEILQPDEIWRLFRQVGMVVK